MTYYTVAVSEVDNTLFESLHKLVHHFVVAVRRRFTAVYCRFHVVIQDRHHHHHQQHHHQQHAGVLKGSFRIAQRASVFIAGVENHASSEDTKSTVGPVIKPFRSEHFLQSCRTAKLGHHHHHQHACVLDAPLQLYNLCPFTHLKLI